MENTEAGPNLIDAYIAGFPPAVQERMHALRATIHAAAPGAGEKISYGMPTFVRDGNLVYFAGHKTHIGFYPTPNGIAEFAADIAPYAAGKGTLQFPHDQPLPLDLVTRIVRYRAAANAAQAAKPRSRRSSVVSRQSAVASDGETAEGSQQ